MCPMLGEGISPCRENLSAAVLPLGLKPTGFPQAVPPFHSHSALLSLTQVNLLQVTLL